MCHLVEENEQPLQMIFHRNPVNSRPAELNQNKEILYLAFQKICYHIIDIFFSTKILKIGFLGLEVWFEGVGSVLSAHLWLSGMCNSTSMGPNVLSDLHGHQTGMCCACVHVSKTQSFKIKINKLEILLLVRF